MRVFVGDRVAAIMDRLKVDEDTPIENSLISRSLEGAQKKVEGFHFDTRKHVVQYDDVMNRHRKAVYVMRREVLMQTDISKRIKLMVDDEVKALAASPMATSTGFDEVVREIFPFDEPTLDRLFDTDTLQFEGVLKAEAHELYNARELAFTPAVLRKVERDIYLQVLDNLWMQHLENMDHLKEGIHWMAVGQQDPLVEYRRRSQMLFDEMQLTLRHEVIRALYHAIPVSPEDLQRPAETELTRAARHSVENADQITTAEVEFEEADFKKQTEAAAKKKAGADRKKARKTERKRKTVARKRK